MGDQDFDPWGPAKRGFAIGVVAAAIVMLAIFLV
jgi:hypothetical protein